jgi:hypothetical protein
MPIEKIIALASVIVAGIMATHPFTWRTELRKLEYSMLKEVSDTRSWGNPSLFQYAPAAPLARRAHHAEK